MEIETLVLAAVQSSFMLGLLHGVNPCGHSWLVLAPFVTGERSGKRVCSLTIMFLAGTGIACIVLGTTLGAISSIIPAYMESWVEATTSIILIGTGLLLLYDPHILHHHDEHDHDHSHNHNEHCHHETCQGKEDSRYPFLLKNFTQNRKILPIALFIIGFVNMIIPCPTAAVMYGYALRSDNVLTATLVFASYAVATALSVGIIIYLIFRAKSLAGIQKEWLEPVIMRFAGIVVILFSAYSLILLIKP